MGELRKLGVLGRPGRLGIAKPSCHPSALSSPSAPSQTRTSSTSRTPRLQSRSRHLLSYSAEFQEIGFLPFDKPRQYDIRLSNQHYCNICNRFIGTQSHSLHIKCSVIMRCAYSSSLQGARIVLVPQTKRADAKIVFVIQHQLLQTGFRDIGQFDFCLFRCRTCRTSLRNILFAASRRLHHLISRPVASVEICFCEIYRYVINTLRFAKRYQITIPATLRKKCFIGSHNSCFLWEN